MKISKKHGGTEKVGTANAAGTTWSSTYQTIGLAAREVEAKALAGTAKRSGDDPQDETQREMTTVTATGVGAAETGPRGRDIDGSCCGGAVLCMSIE